MIPVEGYGHWWSISPFTGALFKHNSKPKISEIIPRRVQDALARCDNPFSLKSNIKEPFPVHEPYDKIRINRLVSLSLSIQNLPFFLQTLFFSKSRGLFTNTQSAMIAINNVSEEIQYTKCLQKTLLASSISESFESEGILFIGCNLPTAEMHAWIIENDYQPDPLDRIWINYKPLLAIFKS